MEPHNPGRRYDLDWLRVLAFAAVFLYHCSRFFDESYWHIKNATTSELIDGIVNFFNLWGMPLIFLISGGSIFFALRPGGAVRFLRDRVSRLLIPLALGILILGPPQIYLERVFHGEFQGSFLNFLPLYFRDWRIFNGNFAWTGVHLWYLEYLFLFTLVLLPLFAALKTPSGLRILERLGVLSAYPGVIFLWSLPVALILVFLDPFSVLRPSLPEYLVRLILYPIFVVYGFLLFGSLPLQKAIVRQRLIFVAVALAGSLVAPAATRWIEVDPTLLRYALVLFLASLLALSAILAVLGYGMRYLTRSHPVLTYANEAVLPFYILHQPVILIIGSFIIPLPLPIPVKYMIIAASAFGITIGLYEVGVRRVDVVRRVFGLKPLKKDLPAVNLVAKPLS